MLSTSKGLSGNSCLNRVWTLSEVPSDSRSLIRILFPLADLLDRRALEAALFERGARLVDRNLLLETELHRGAADKVDAEVRLAAADLDQAHDAEHDEQGGNRKGDVLPPHEVDVGLMQYLKHFFLQELIKFQFNRRVAEIAEF